MGRLSAALKQPLTSGSDVRLRPWQQEAFGIYRDAVTRGEKSQLWEATPGAGKTTAALVVALHQLRRCSAERTIVVVPTAHLKGQWARAASQMGVELSLTFSAKVGLTRDFNGLAVTYHQIAQNPQLFRRFAQRSVVILDEAHHAGDGLTWGASLRMAFHDSQFILSLSGTPFRSDNNPIPFVEYDDNGISVPDYSYTYSRAVEEGICRPTAFFTFGGEVAWREQSGDVSARFTDPLDPIGSSRRLRAALDSESGWISPMIREAHQMLLNVRAEHRDAGALLVAPDQQGARKLARLITLETGVTPAVVLSDDTGASRRLRAFRDSNDMWLIACNMVSEGVDIPRLRIGVYATTVRTKMYFRQFLGRIVRRTPSSASIQVAYCFLPADPSLVFHAEEIEKEIRHCIRPRNKEDFEFPEARERDREKPPVTWEPLASVNGGIETIIVHGNQLNLFDSQQTVGTTSVREVVHEQIVKRLDQRRSRAEEKAFLAAEIRKKVSVYHKKSRRTHAQIHQQLNAMQGVRSQTMCTEEQLRERLRLLHGLLDRVT